MKPMNERKLKEFLKRMWARSAHRKEGEEQPQKPSRWSAIFRVISGYFSLPNAAMFTTFNRVAARERRIAAQDAFHYDFF